jgi:nucleotide-binding universal stress UspA family protein
MSVHSPSADDTERRDAGASPEAPSARLAPDVSLGEELRYCPIVVAVSGEPDGAAPVRVAAALERRFGSRVSAVQVRDISNLPLPVPLPTAFTVARELIGDAPYRKDVEARREQFAEWLGAPNEWPVHVAVGSAAYEVLRYAEHEGAALIVMGLRRHGVVDRVLHDETTLTVARRARGVVLGVVPALQTLPRRALVGVDFGPASIRAARAALDVLATPGPGDPVLLRLVYVDRSGVEGVHEDTAGEALIKRLGIDAAFERLVEELQAPPGVHVECAVRHGVPAAELLSCADECRADLIAMGSLRHERLERWILGSVTTEVVRDGRCSVLVIRVSRPTAASDR